MNILQDSGQKQPLEWRQTIRNTSISIPSWLLASSASYTKICGGVHFKHQTILVGRFPYLNTNDSSRCFRVFVRPWNISPLTVAQPSVAKNLPGGHRRIALILQDASNSATRHFIGSPWWKTCRFPGWFTGIKKTTTAGKKKFPWRIFVVKILTIGCVAWEKILKFHGKFHEIPIIPCKTFTNLYTSPKARSMRRGLGSFYHLLSNGTSLTSRWLNMMENGDRTWWN